MSKTRSELSGRLEKINIVHGRCDLMNDQRDGSKRNKPRLGTVVKRQQIIKAASEVFGMKGTSNATLEEIANKVGMTRSGILHHFGSKRALLLSVLQYRDSSAVEGLESHHIPGGEALFRHLISTARRNEQKPGLVYTFVTLSAESITEGNPGHDYFYERYANLRNEITDALIAMAKERRTTIDMGKAIMASSAILAVMDGLQLQWLLDGQSVSLSESTEFAINAIVASVVPDVPPV